MPSFENGKVYKIVCNITNEFYIGSTEEPTLARRLADHVYRCKRWKVGKSRMITSYRIIDRNDYEILLMEKFPCDSRDELKARESFYQKQAKGVPLFVNKKIEGRTSAEYNVDNREKMKKYNADHKERTKKWEEDNKERLIERRKQYRVRNKDIINIKRTVKISCICGSSICKSEKPRHERTKKHLDFLQTLQ